MRIAGVIQTLLRGGVGLLCLPGLILCGVTAQGAALGGVPAAVWQDNDRSHRRSPSQIKTQISAPQSRSLPLEADAQSPRAARVRGQLAANSTPLAREGQLDMLGQSDWRLKILPAAVTHTDMVLLGDIASPLGHMDQQVWEQLRAQPLWASPPDEGKPSQINRSRLSQALWQALGKDMAGRCILPSSLTIQRGGLIFREDDLRAYVVKSLTPLLAAMPGEAELTDFRLPEYIFLAHSRQKIQLEAGKLTPGRVVLRFAVQEADGTVLRRVAGTTSLVLWITVPAAARPMNKGDALTAQSVTFLRVNAGRLQEVPWDGRGGPWKLARSLNTGEPIVQSDLVSQLMVSRGDIVTLVFAKGNLRITAQAQVMADGEPGASVPVRNLQTKKQVYATVRDGSTVEVR